MLQFRIEGTEGWILCQRENYMKSGMEVKDVGIEQAVDEGVRSCTCVARICVI
jgi:hypothetical protein